MITLSPLRSKLYKIVPDFFGDFLFLTCELKSIYFFVKKCIFLTKKNIKKTAIRSGLKRILLVIWMTVLLYGHSYYRKRRQCAPEGRAVPAVLLFVSKVACARIGLGDKHLSLQLWRGGSTFLPRCQGTGSIFFIFCREGVRIWKKSPPSASPSLTAPPKRAKKD